MKVIMNGNTNKIELKYKCKNFLCKLNQRCDFSLYKEKVTICEYLQCTEHF